MHGSPSRGQATIGYALVIGIALIGTITVVALGATALTDIQTNAGTGAAEQAMTQFDSQTSQVALGDSTTQTVSVGRTDGSYEVDPDAGHVRVVHINFDGGGNNDGNTVTDGGSNDDEELLYESTLGTVRYRRGGTTIGYQSGGVWKKPDNGQARMVSPPEFHYRGSTLTFPIVRVNQNGGGSQSGGGAIDLRVTQPNEPRDIYPTRGDGYPDTDGDDDGFNDAGNGDPYGVNGHTDVDNDGDGGFYENPATNGTVVVYIQSEYYRAWANYFRDRTDGKVDTTDDSGGLVGTSFDIDGDGDAETDIVAVELVSTGFTGAFEMPGEGSSLPLRGIEDHKMSDFEITLVPDSNDQAKFDNLQWSMYASEGNKRMEIYLKRGSGGDKKCGDGDGTDLKADLSIYYSDDGGDTYNGWHADDAFAAECEDIDGDGDKEIKLEADFVDDDNGDGTVVDVETANEGDPKLQYVDKGGMNNLVHFGISGSDVPVDPYEMKGHGDWEPKTYDLNTGDADDRETVDRIVNHYFSEFGTLDLTVDDKGSDTVSEAGSGGSIDYQGAGRFITYIHLSENDVRVKIN